MTGMGQTGASRFPTRSMASGGISFYLLPANDGLLEGQVHPLSCKECSQPPGAVPEPFALLFCSAKTHRLEWAHLSCSRKLRFDAETLRVGLHPGVAESDGRVLLSRLLLSSTARAGSTIWTVPFKFPAAYKGPDLVWQTLEAADCKDETAPVATSSEASGKTGLSKSPTTASQAVGTGSSAPESKPTTACTKRALRCNTSDPVEPTLASEAYVEAAVPRTSKKGLKTSSGDVAPEETQQVAISIQEVKPKPSGKSSDGITQQTSSGDDVATACGLVTSTAQPPVAEEINTPPGREVEATTPSKPGSSLRLLRAGA